MTDKRFINDIDNGKLIDTKGELSTIYYSNSVDFYELWEFLNKLNDENEQLKQENKELKGKASSWKITASEQIMEQSELVKKNEQLKQDNNVLIHLLENQSMIIQELHSKLLEYQVKEPIVLTKEDLKLMGKAISYYTHGRCGE